MNEEKRDAVEKYFYNPIMLLLWSLTFAGSGIWSLIEGKISIIWSIVLLIICILLFRLFREKLSVINEISDQAIDKYIDDDLSRIKAESLEKASIDKSELVCESVVVTGPRLQNTANLTVSSRKGDDGKLRFTPINISVLHLTQNQVISYQCCLDLMTGKVYSEILEEYFYKDVVSVTTKTVSKSFLSDKFGKLQLDAAEVFVLTTSGGTSIETILRDPKLIEKMGGGEIPTEGVEQAIKVARKMLREMKQQAINTEIAR